MNFMFLDNPRVYIREYRDYLTPEILQYVAPDVTIDRTNHYIHVSLYAGGIIRKHSSMIIPFKYVGIVEPEL